ncbi:von Willebrand factor type A domain containing protein [Histomonas meleagridis]|uniref:von Willebrand factor type A domain containing protein n=1 Tax=Histomonas meleagridis TaxID=135588 RepID=UPI003559552F|nr:von Willebrand factor type A domain containing protein [Histomonas meleagridis]KAH0802401.1 von Willebrand factor type A domain containing protein [Histomonas meleagridis]
MYLGHFQVIEDKLPIKIPLKSITITGEQRGTIIDLQTTQSFTTESEIPELIYSFPNDNQICTYKTEFIVGDKVVPLKLEDKGNAQATYREAVNTGHFAFIVQHRNNGYSNFCLGNVPAGVDVKVIINSAFEGTLEDPRTILFKFPIQSSILNHIDFDFKLRIQQPVHISNVSVNCSEFEFIKSSPNQGILHIKSSPDNSTKDSYFIKTHLETEFQSVAYQANNSSAIIFVPNIDIIPKSTNEIIFFIDCSGSMSGSRINNAKRCLQLFIRSLPMNCSFNIIRFGSKYQTLFENSLPYNQENFESALNCVQNMKADLGGTNIYSPLEYVLKLPTNNQRQLLILTDGEIDDPLKIYQLLKENYTMNRCFTIGFGSGADLGTISIMASITSGQSVFINDGEDLSMKIIPLLNLSISNSITNINVHVENQNNFEVVPFPIPITLPKTSRVLYINTKINNDFVLVNGNYNDSDNDFMIKVENWDTNCIYPLFAYQMIRNLELNNENKEKCIKLSIESGVISKFTAYVGLIEYKLPSQLCAYRNDVNSSNVIPSMDLDLDFEVGNVYSDYRDFSDDESSEEDHSQLMKYENEKNSFDFMDIVKLQQIEGYWEKNQKILEFAGLQEYPTLTEIKNCEGMDRVISTVLAVAVLRKKALEKRDSWQLIETKALNWLKGINNDINWDEIINRYIL